MNDPLKPAQWYVWLVSQQSRQDDVGSYARSAIANICYPRSGNIQILLRYESEASRPLLKRVHREWRRVHARQVAARHASKAAS